VKSLASLALFYIASFVIILVLAGAVVLLGVWAEAAVFFPPVTIASGIAGALTPAISAALYLSLLAAAGYAAVRRAPYPAVLAVLVVLAAALGTAASLGLSRLDGLVSFKMTVPPLSNGGNGLLLTVSPELPVQAVLLQNGKGRVVSLPEQPLFFERSSSEGSSLRLPFREERTSFLRGISGDFSRGGAVLKGCFQAGMIPFAVYAASLSLFLVSLGCLVNISFWPLANLFFGALVFRGVLALETFLNSEKTRLILASFAGPYIPDSLINPAIFTFCAVLILVYSGLVYLARGRRNE
jgi:hypothetical protein